jgi:hypothetical protein
MIGISWVGFYFAPPFHSHAFPAGKMVAKNPIFFNNEGAVVPIRGQRHRERGN